MAQIDDIRAMPMVELQEEEIALRKEIFNLKMKLPTDAAVRKDYRQAKKQLAQVMTVQTQVRKESQAS